MEGQIKEVVLRYADIRADKEKEYLELIKDREFFVPADYEQTEDGLKFCFRLNGLFPFSELYKEEEVRKYAVLLKTLELHEPAEIFAFSLHPDNLFYSLTGQVKVLVRDIADSEEDNGKEFLKNYKALAGAVLYRKYTYEDFREGGESLLKKKQSTEKIYESRTLEELQTWLEERVQKAHTERLSDQLVVNKKSQKRLKFAVFLFGIMAAAGAAFASYYLEMKYPYETAVQNAMNAYIDKNYIALIDSMKAVGLKQMDRYQKYILSEAYINSENLSVEQKQTILATLTTDQNEKIFDYWICIGRQEPVEAQNIAMQLSDDELLLYAYLLDRDLTRVDTGMDGEEKKKKLGELDQKIEEYTEKIVEEEIEDDEF